MTKPSFILLSLRAAAAVFTFSMSMARADMPDAIAADGQTLVAVVHAEGAQVYECKADELGQPKWQFREPIATLMMDGKTVGRHFAGPSWELADGSMVRAKVVARAPGATTADIPLLKLEVVAQSEIGQLSAIDLIQRINTHGGILEGPCSSPGTMTSVPYAADYAFLQRKD